jgi:hypothetical protein
VIWASTLNSAREAVAQPLLLFPDDRDGLGVDEDGVGRCVDLALAVAEAGDGVPFRGLDGAVRGRGQAVEGTQADLAGAAAGKDLQQEHPHQLRVSLAGQRARAAAGRDGDCPGSRLAEHGQAGGDLREGVIIDVTGLIVEGLAAS